MSTPIRPGTDSGAGYTPGSEMPPKPEKSSLIEDFIDIFHAPSAVFSRRAMSGFWMPLLVVCIVGAAFAFANRGINSQIGDVEFSRASAAAASDPRITPEMIAQQRAIMDKVMGFMSYIMTPVALFVLGFGVWLVAKIVKARVSYEQAVLIATFAWVPRLIEQLTVTVQALVMDTTAITNRWDVSLSAARFMDTADTSVKLVALLGRIDVFTIWATILIAIGIATIGKVERSKGYIAAGTLFVLGTLFVAGTAR
jgi:hypothetical protein